MFTQVFLVGSVLLILVVFCVFGYFVFCLSSPCVLCAQCYFFIAPSVLPSILQVLSRIHTNFILQDNALILCISCRTIIDGDIMKFTSIQLSLVFAPLDIYCQQEIKLNFPVQWTWNLTFIASM